MNRPATRVQLARGYVLHRYPFRDSSLILEVFARDHGRISLFARAVRGPRMRGALLEPFDVLLLSWSGRGEAPALTGAEYAAALAPLPAARLMSAFYLNELLLRLTTRHDPQPELFDTYEQALTGLRAGQDCEAELRRFEVRLLALIGYGLNLTTEADTGHPVRDEARYHFHPGVHGVVLAGADGREGEGLDGQHGAAPIAGEVLRRLASGAGFADAAQTRQARALMRAALDNCLDGRALRTRTVARAISGFPRREGRI
jgi:DNA repair protein RecO (recombination protein O)